MTTGDFSIITFLCSVFVSVFISGMWVGKFSSKLDEVVTRLAKIEGMFTLRLKDHDRDEN